MNGKLFEYIEKCPTVYHAAEHTAKLLEERGYTALRENDAWELEGGRGYYVTRGGSSLIAFRMPQDDFIGFMIAASHCDSPCFRIKENAELDDGHIKRLSVEKYGGMLCSSWLDRPLSVAGRVILHRFGGVESVNIRLPGISALIPNVAIHMNRGANEGTAYNAAVDMLPMFSPSGAGAGFGEAVADAAGAKVCDILSSELYLFNPEPGVEWNGFISAPRLDDLQCAYAALEAFLNSGEGGSIPVYCLFDNEEVGSATRQGAASTFLRDTLEEIVRSRGGDSTVYRRAVSESFLVSCDNAHAVHPNHGEYSDKNHQVYMNGGIVFKYNAGRRYATDAVSSGLFKLICDEASVPVQLYANRADMPGGSTLGSIASTVVSMNTIDIGLPQLAMHSAFETAGASDTGYLASALKVFFERTLCMERDGKYRLL